MSAATHRPMPAPARPCAAAAAVIECNAAGAGRGLLPLVRLLQLASPALPVGAYTYSQGLEWAVESGLVRSEAEAAAWIGELLEWSLARFEVPLLGCQLAAWSRNEDAELARLNDDFLASRETAELRAETVQMGWSLVRLLAELDAFASIPGWRARLLAIESIGEGAVDEYALFRDVWLQRRNYQINQTSQRIKAKQPDADLPAYLQEDGQDAPAQDGSPDGTPPAKPAGS